MLLVTVHASIVWLLIAAHISSFPSIGRASDTGAIRMPVHHGYAGDCDFSKPVAISGEVVRAVWANPHIWIAIRTSEPNPVTWWIEADSPYALRARGWTSASLPPHMLVSARGYSARQQSRACGCQLMLDDGRKVVLSDCGRLRTNSPGR